MREVPQRGHMAATQLYERPCRGLTPLVAGRNHRRNTVGAQEEKKIMGRFSHRIIIRGAVWKAARNILSEERGMLNRG
jgi:hypothetical protein